ncbi:hypothetical protein YC2023_053369 [Brassica napus]
MLMRCVTRGLSSSVYGSSCCQGGADESCFLDGQPEISLEISAEIDIDLGVSDAGSPAKLDEGWSHDEVWMVELGGESAFWVSLRSGLRFPVSRSTPPRWCERVAERGCFLSPDPVAWHQAPGPWRSRPVPLPHASCCRSDGSCAAVGFCSEAGPSMTFALDLSDNGSSSVLSVLAAFVVNHFVVIVPRFSVLARGGLLGAPLGHWSDSTLWEARMKIDHPSTAVGPLGSHQWVNHRSVLQVKRNDDKMWLSLHPGGSFQLVLLELLFGAEVCCSRRSGSPTAGGSWEAWLPSTEFAKLSGSGINQLEQCCGEAKITKTWSNVISKVPPPFGNALFGQASTSVFG